jgi:hypothetical protein
MTRVQEFLTALRHEPPEGFTERNFAAVFELLHNLAQWMLGDLFSGVIGPRAGADEIRRARQTSGAMMVIPTRVREGTAASVAQWMRNQPDLSPTYAAKVFSIPAIDGGATSTAAGWVEPVNQPIKTIR